LTRKGYFAEYLAKQKLIEEYGDSNIIKIAISQQGADLLCLRGREIVKLVEVKSTKGKKWYPVRPKDIIQFNKIIDFASEKEIVVEFWIKTGGSTEFEILSETEFKERYSL